VKAGRSRCMRARSASVSTSQSSERVETCMRQTKPCAGAARVSQGPTPCTSFAFERRRGGRFVGSAMHQRTLKTGPVISAEPVTVSAGERRCSSFARGGRPERAGLCIFHQQTLADRKYRGQQTPTVRTCRGGGDEEGGGRGG
jgi:hypothetical protein